jgi:hypothetical protein
MKTIIQAWTQECLNVETGPGKLYWGLGDLIRSTMFLHQYCLLKGYRFVVDFQCHPVSSFLEKQEHEFQTFVFENRNQIPFVPRGKVIPFIEDSSNEIILLFGCEFCREPLPTETLDFVKKFLVPNQELQMMINRHLAILPADFGILHFRLGDEAMEGQLTQNELGKAIKILQKHGTPNDLFITDSEALKIEVIKLGLLRVFKLKIGHLGLCKDHEIIRDTLVEFFVITSATKIKTYTVYPWISSFVYWISKVYAIPLQSVFGGSIKLILYRLFWNIQSKLSK